MLEFDYRGFLIPYKNIISNVAELKDIFAGGSLSERRKEIFEKYLIYSNCLKEHCNQPFIQWINGSYCTLKKEPADIDIVSFIPHIIIESNENLYKQFSYPVSQNKFSVDAYLVKTFAESNRYYPQYAGDKLYWLSKFSKTKLNRARNRYSKGFLEIIF